MKQNFEETYQSKLILHYYFQKINPSQHKKNQRSVVQSHTSNHPSPIKSEVHLKNIPILLLSHQNISSAIKFHSNNSATLSTYPAGQKNIWGKFYMHNPERERERENNKGKSKNHDGHRYKQPSKSRYDHLVSTPPD